MRNFGLLGEKLGHSLSPEIHRIIFKKLNIEGTYALFEIKKENQSSSRCFLWYVFWLETHKWYGNITWIKKWKSRIWLLKKDC